MALIQPGRYRPNLEGAGDIAVFLIGARLNHWWKVHRWWPVARAMPRMIRELEQRPELGLLGYETWPGRTTIMVQYWRSMDHLFRYARSRDSEHLPAWRDFNRRASTDAVGLWHEAYPVRLEHVHAIYSNMPRFGLGRARVQTMPSTIARTMGAA